VVTEGHDDSRLGLACLGLHPERAARLAAEFGSAGAAVAAVRAGKVEAPEASRSVAALAASELRARLAAIGAEAVLRGSGRYPPWLAELPGAPDVLFALGRLPERRGVAVVGTRTATVYGLRLAHSFGRALAEAGWPVISGLARGIDGAAHRGCLEGGTPGVAVLGSGVDVCYPPEHRELGLALVGAGGAVVSEYPLGARPEPWRFPLRNRIISGLAAAVVVVEARRDGGALITARMGLEQGREVFAVPGDVDRVSSEGCNLLIRDGAHPVLGADDLVEALSLLPDAPRRPARGAACLDPLVDLAGPVGRPVEWLASQLECPMPELLARIARLELEGLVRLEGELVVASGCQPGARGAP
jgi:DNA processing protein